MSFSEWEQEITARNMERILSIVFQLQHVEKSITDDLVYDLEIKIEKTGREIKEKLMEELNRVVSNKNSLASEMERLLTEIGEAPRGKAENWELRGYEKYFAVVPFKYSYTQVYPAGTESKGELLQADAPVDSIEVKSIQDKMRAYNKTVNEYISRFIEELRLKTVINNLSDDKKVKLNPRLASELGF